MRRLVIPKMALNNDAEDKIRELERQLKEAQSKASTNYDSYATPLTGRYVSPAMAQLFSQR